MVAKKSVKDKPIVKRPPSRSCMINYDVFGHSQPFTMNYAP